VFKKNQSVCIEGFQGVIEETNERNLMRMLPLKRTELKSKNEKSLNKLSRQARGWCDNVDNKPRVSIEHSLFCAGDLVVVYGRNTRRKQQCVFVHPKLLASTHHVIVLRLQG